MTSPPSSDAVPIGKRLRHKLLALWLGSILGVVLLVGAVLTVQMDDFRAREARREIGAAVAQVRHELVATASSLLRHADLLSSRPEVVSAINMVHRYQDVAHYQPMVFDFEKRALALTLADRLISADLRFAAVYDGHGRPAAWALAADGNAVPAYHTVVDGREIMLANSETGWQPAASPPLMRSGQWTERIPEGDVIYRALDGRLVMETVMPVERNLPNAPATTVGWVHLATVVDAAMLGSLANRTDADLAVAVGDTQVGTLLPVALPSSLPLPDIASSLDCPCGWLEVGDMTVGATGLDLDDGTRAAILAGTSGTESQAVLRFYQVSAVLVLLAVAGVVAPGGLLVLNASIVAPLSRLLRGAEALRAGRRVRLAEHFRDDEFGTLARGFDAMAAGIAEREDELRATIDQLAHSNAELERFAVVAAHDLQEPLRMVASYTQLLKRRYHGQLGTDADEFIDYAVDGAERMKALIQNLLEYSRVEGDQAPFTMADCNEVVAAVLRTLAPAIAETAARIRIDPLPGVRGNPVQLGQVFQNLLSNALKFRRTTPEIDIRARREDHEWLFTVRDNGIGIAADYMPQLFTLFRRLHTRQEYPGQGLGLAIARRIVERHGGRMWAESEEGVGTTILFTLPAVVGAEDVGLDRESQAKLRHPRAGGGHGAATKVDASLDPRLCGDDA